MLPAWLVALAGRALALAAVLGALTAGALWLRHDARREERALWEAKAAAEARRVAAANAAAKSVEAHFIMQINDLEARNAALVEDINALPILPSDGPCALPRDRVLQLNRIR